MQEVLNDSVQLRAYSRIVGQQCLHFLLTLPVSEFGNLVFVGLQKLTVESGVVVNPLQHTCIMPGRKLSLPVARKRHRAPSEQQRQWALADGISMRNFADFLKGEDTVHTVVGVGKCFKVVFPDLGGMKFASAPWADGLLAEIFLLIPLKLFLDHSAAEQIVNLLPAVFAKGTPAHPAPSLFPGSVINDR